MDPFIMDFEIRLTVIDVRGTEETGIGNGVVRDIICSFFTELCSSHMIGCQEKVPNVRHDMGKEQWQSIARIMIYGVRLGYFPLFFSQAFMSSTLFGEEHLNMDFLVNSLKQCVSVEEQDVIQEMMSTFHQDNEHLLDLLSSYQCFQLPTADNLKGILSEIAHQELVQKPRYIANCFSEVFSPQ